MNSLDAVTPDLWQHRLTEEVSEGTPSNYTQDEVGVPSNLTTTGKKK
jgi:hypothetical protein